MLRGFVAALLLANLAFFAWTQGWLDGVVGARAIGDREPERLARQVRPEMIRILPAASGARSAAPDALACLEAGPFNDSDAASVQAQLPGGNGVIVKKTEQPGTWIVYMGRYADREAFKRKQEELGRRKLAFEEMRDNPALVPGLSLGRFDDRGAAAQALEQLAAQGIRTARVVELAPPSSRLWLRVERADAALAAKLLALKTDALGKGFVPCAGGTGN